MKTFPRPRRHLAALPLLLAACATATAQSEDAKGLKELSAGHAREAYDHFVKAVRRAPDDLAAYRHLVDAARASGTLDALTAEAQAALVSNEGEALAHYRLGLCLFAHTDRERAGIDELAQATKLAESGGASVEVRAETLTRYGAALLEAERPEEALAPLRAAVLLRPGEAHPRLPLVLALHRSGRDPEAIAEIDGALELFPSRADIDAYRHVMDRIGAPAHAVPAAVKPRFEDAIGALSSQTPERAIELLEALLDEQPQIAPAQAALGLAYLKSGDNAQAVFHLRRAVELDPSAAEPHLYLGEIFHDLHHDDEAKTELELAVARDPLLDVARDHLIQLALQQNDPATAAHQARALAGIRVGDSAARLQLAQTLKLSGDLAGAEQQLAQVADPPKSDGEVAEGVRFEAQVELGGLELEEGLKVREAGERGRRFELARLWLGKALRIQPDNANAQHLLESVPK